MMLEIYERLEDETGVDAKDNTGVDSSIILDHEQRDKGRLRAVSSDGDEVRLFLDRGRPLRVGEVLRSSCGRTVRIEGAVEPVLTARCDDWLQFSRACYHLGNRHVKLQVGDRWLRIAPDHVLEDLLLQLGLQVQHEEAVFIPESGAYHSGHHHH